MSQVQITIFVENPSVGVCYGLQKGKGVPHDVVQKTIATEETIHFAFSAELKKNTKDELGFFGEHIHGKTNDRFVYINVGQSAGQYQSVWSRRIKVPLYNIPQSILEQLACNPNPRLTTNIPGKGKDGTPNCATVKPFGGWRTID